MKANSAAMSLLLGLGLAAVANPASATTLYEHNNYNSGLGGWTLTTTHNADLAHRKNQASSVDASRTMRYYDGINFTGWTFSSSADYNCLGCVTTGLPSGFNWGDRIDSVRSA